MHVASQQLHVLNGCARKNAMSEVEDVAGPAAGTLQDLVGACQEPLDGREEQGGIKIALDGAIVPDSIPGIVQSNSPVCPDDVAAGYADPAATPLFRVTASRNWIR